MEILILLVLFAVCMSVVTPVVTAILESGVPPILLGFASLILTVMILG